MMASSAASLAISGGLEAFRYRSASKYYDSYKIGSDTNYFKLSDQIRNFTYLGIGGCLATTSLLAAFGIATGLNLLVWMLFGGIVGGLAGIAIGIIRFLAYDAGYTAYTGSDVAKKASGSATMGAVKKDAIRDSIFDIGVGLVLAGSLEAIMWEQWNMASLEDQEEQMAENEKLAAELAASVAEMREAAGLTGMKAAEAAEEDAEEEEGEGEDAEEEEGEDAEGEDEEAEE